MIAFRRLARKSGAQDFSSITRKRRLFLIKMYKAWIIVLALCLIGGIVKGANVHPLPLFPMAVGIAMNLLTTSVLVMAVRKLQKSLD